MNLSGFYKLSIDERLNKLKEVLDGEDITILRKTGALDLDMADRMIENVIGTNELPIGIANNFCINGKDMLIPMSLEEPSVIAGASKAAKMCCGFEASADDSFMIGQIQVVNIDKIEVAKKAIIDSKDKFFEICNRKDSTMVRMGGGLKDVEAKKIKTDVGEMLIVYLHVDVKDAMGANAVNTMAEKSSNLVEELTGGKVRLRIISNLSPKRMARAKTRWKKEFLHEDVIDGIIEAYHFAKNDLYRCATHNKGIMNGIDALTLATGNDFRAVEAGAHAYASIDGYKPLTKFYKDDGDLIGEIELPIALGTVGGATKTNPVAQVALKLLDVKSSQELAEIAACVGLANNFAALRALVEEGINKGHMKLHSRNIAINAGATGNDIDKIAEQLVEENNVTVSRARELLEK